MEKYEFVKDIGVGSFGLTKLMRNKETKELVAVKLIARGHEVLLTTNHLLIVMEYAAGGELYDCVSNAGRFSEDEARYFFQQLISGVSYCHFMQISHGDLKLANTLLDGSPAPRLKICDFGYPVSSLLHSKPKSIADALRYIAPEVLSGTEYDDKFADVWSCGVTLYVMLVGAYPFEDQKAPDNFEKTTQLILGAQYEIPAYRDISEECRHLLSRIFVAPARRITIQEIKTLPWFLKNQPREVSAAAESMYYSRTAPTFFIQSVEEIMKIVEEAKNPTIYPPFVSDLIAGFRWNDNDQEEYVELEMGGEEVEDEYEVAEQNGYDKKMKESYEDKQVKEF